MFRQATPQNTPRSRQQTGLLSPLTLPSKGLNARDTFAVMGAEYAITLTNVLVEPYGLRTRKGYSEWATGIPAAEGPSPSPVYTVMIYYPATAAPEVMSLVPFKRPIGSSLFVEPRVIGTEPAGKLFASRAGLLYDVTSGGDGPWSAEADVSGDSDFWTWINFQNVAGSFLVITNDEGGYAYYNGTVWATPVAGAAPGEIDGVDPDDFVFVTEFKKRLWFVEKDTTRAWYLPVSQITGAATMFDFGEQFRKGGKLVALANWTVDGGAGVDDYLVAFGSQGDVVVYKGVDPDDPTNFALHGVWDVGALPVGRRSITNTGADVLILSQFGVTPLSALLSTTQLGALEEKRITFIIAPLIARLMRDYSTLDNWQVRMLPKEELIVIGIPRSTPEFGGNFFVLKFTTGAWSILRDLPYVSFVNVDSAVFAGTFDGRVVRAFNGPLDNVPLDESVGTGIACQVTPSYQPLGPTGQQKIFSMVRPTFITTVTPILKIRILVDYGPPRQVVVPTLPVLVASLWDVDLWDAARWSGVQDPIKRWLGCQGVGFVGTVQLDYRCGGDTLLASIDFWTQPGGVM